MENFSDEYFMQQAYREAQKAFDLKEVPVGAVIVSHNQILGRAHNQVEQLQDPTAHAEILVITAACDLLGSKVLNECTLYVTLEPCAMCAGALYWAKLGRIVFGAEDSKGGFMRFGRELLHPKTKLEMGIMSKQCSSLLTEFFKQKRK